MSESLRDLVVSLSLNSDNFSRNIKSVNAQIREAESLFKLAGAGVTKFESTTAGLSSKLSMLQQKVGLQKSAVTQYERALAAANARLEKSYAGNEKLKASLDAARDKYAKTGAEITKLKDEMAALESAMGGSADRYVEAGLALERLEQEHTATGKQIKLLEGQIISSNKEIQNNADKVSQAQSALNGAQAELRETEVAIKKCSLELKASESLWTKAGSAMTKFGEKAKSVGKTSSAIGKELNRYVTAPIAALGGYAAKTSMDFQDAFAGVRKTVQMTEADYQKLDQAIRNMTLVKPATYEQIAYVAETAGQLGVAEKAVAGFTSVMTDLGAVCTDLDAEQAATGLAKLANIMGVTEGKQTNEYFERMGSTVLDLGINSASTESSIIEMAMRLAAAGRQVGLTEAQVLGYAAALSSVGIEAQMGGTAFSKALIKMEVATVKGGQALTDFARVSGLSEEAFTALFKANPGAAFEAFIGGLAKMDEEGESAIATLDEIGMKEVRLRDTMLRTVNATELMQRMQGRANQAWKDNTAIHELVNARYNTTAKRLEMLRNKARLAASTFSDAMLPSMEDVMGGASSLLDRFMKLDEAQRKQIVSTGLWVAAAGPAFSTFGKVSSVVGDVSGALGKFAAKVGTAGGGLKGLVSVVGSSKLAMLGLTGALLVGAYQLYDWASGAKAAREALEGMNATADKWRQGQAKTVYSGGGLEALGLSKEQFSAGPRSAKQWMADVVAVWSDGKAETDEIIGSFSDTFTTLTDNTKTALEKLKQTAQQTGHTGVADTIQQDMDELDGINQKIAKLLKKRKNKKLSEQDKVKLQELIDAKEAIEVKYKLTPEQTGGYAQILQSVQTEVARAQARGQKGADPKVYEQGLTGAAEGYAAIREQIDQNYASEYALIQLMDEGAEKEAAKKKLDADYNDQRKKAAEEYAATIRQLIAPVWNEDGVQKAKGDMDALTQLFREYSTLGSEGYKDPKVLEKMNELFADMNKDDIVSYLGVLQQVQTLMDGGMSEAEVQKLFPEIDMTGNLDQFAQLAQFAKDHDTELKALSDTLSGIVPDEMKKLSVELDMTAAEARWAEFASNPGAITTNAIIQGYTQAPEAVVPQATVDALVQSYREIEGGASTAQLEPSDVVAQVTSYLEAEGCSIAALKPDQVEALVSAYSEATGCDKSALLTAFQAKITGYDDTTAVKPATPKLTSTIQITGYDLAALDAFKKEHPIEVQGILRIGEKYENPEDALKDKDAKFYMNGEQIPVNIVPKERITADTLFVYGEDGSMHVLVTPEIKGTTESTDKAGAKLDEKHWDFNIYGYDEFVPTIDGIKDINAQLTFLQGAMGTWKTFWGLLDGKSKEGMANMLTQNLSPEQLAEIQTFVQESTKALGNGEKLSDDAIQKLQAIQKMVDLLDTLGIGQNVTAGIGAAMAQAGFDGDAETTAGNLEAAINKALGIQSPSTRMKPTGSYAAAGMGAGMTEYAFATDASTTASNLKSALDTAITSSTYKSVGTNAMAGLASGIRSGKSDVTSAIREVADAAVQAAKDRLKIQSPSRVFENEVGVMVTKGMGVGALKETRAQAKVIANAAKYLRGSAQDGASLGGVAYDNRRSYQSDNSIAVNVDKLVVKDKQDVRALAVEIGVVQRRAAMGMGG